MTPDINFNDPQRMWINQPSTQQPFHKYHGAKVLTMPPVKEAGKSGTKYIKVYFTKGVQISMILPVSVLSSGWGE